MLSLLMVAALGQCYGQRTYARQTYYAAPTYYYAAPAKTYYQAPAVQQYQAPAYNYSLVGDYMRQESAYKADVEQAAKLDVLIKLLAERAAPPVQQFQAPQPQFQQPYPSPQSPAKPPPQYELPQAPAKPTPQYELPQAPYPSEQQPPFGTKPSPSSPPTPSFESSSWVPTPTSGGGAVAAMTHVFQTRCTDCHVGTSEKGGGVKLFELDGQLANLEPYLDEIGKAVGSGRMPKKGPRLNPNEMAAVFAGLREYAATARARQNVLASFGQ